MGFYIVHELEGGRIRVVKLGLQVGRLDCGRPEEVQRQAESILGIMRELDNVRATEDRFELQSESGGVAAFVPPAPAQVDPPLVGTEWLLPSLKGEELLPKTEITLEIDKEMVGGSSGCNFYGSEVDKMVDARWYGPGDPTAGWAPRRSDRLILADPAVTKRKCAPAAAAGAEERWLGIRSDVSYYPAVMASGRMTLDTEDGRKLVFSAPG